MVLANMGMTHSSLPTEQKGEETVFSAKIQTEAKETQKDFLASAWSDFLFDV